METSRPSSSSELLRGDRPEEPERGNVPPPPPKRATMDRRGGEMKNSRLEEELLLGLWILGTPRKRFEEEERERGRGLERSGFVGKVVVRPAMALIGFEVR